MTIAAAYQYILVSLEPLYADREAKNIASLILEKLTGYSHSQRILHKKDTLEEKTEKQLQKIINELTTNRPVQYCLEEAWFAGMKFFVNEQVLIPRPETEELVSWILESNPEKKFSETRILDIGTGSGCIAIALKKKLTDASVTAFDISSDALAIARRNAQANQVYVEFLLYDILSENAHRAESPFTIIVSNPPYVLVSEKDEMMERVWKYEPAQALFVSDNDPLIFYKAILRYAEKHLAENGELYFEINEIKANEIQDLLEYNTYRRIEVKKDFQGKARMIRAGK